MAVDAPEEGYTVRDRRGQRVDNEGQAPLEPGAFMGPGKPSSPPAPGPAVSPGPAQGPPRPDATALFILIANSALMHLGAPSGPAGGAEPVDLAQARFSIDLLRVLKEKTAGNLSADEGRLLDGLLYDLQMRFVQAAGAR